MAQNDRLVVGNLKFRSRDFNVDPTVLDEDDFEEEEEIGSGAYGKVRRAFWKSKHMYVAIKGTSGERKKTTFQQEKLNLSKSMELINFRFLILGTTIGSVWGLYFGPKRRPRSSEF